MSQVFLHVGLHKTGTTFLQYHVFPLLEGVRTLHGWQPATALAEGAAPRTLITSENFSGWPWGGGWAEQFEARMRSLAALFPRAKALIGFREHAAMLLSLYKQHLHQGDAVGPGCKPITGWV